MTAAGVRRRAVLVVLASLLAVLFFAPQRATAAKNVILMISDGGGYNTFLAASMYRGKLDHEVYDGQAWVKLSAATYPLNRSTLPTGNTRQPPAVIYDPVKAWDHRELDVERDAAAPFAGYAFLTSGGTDSAAAATAMASGVKTYNNSINWTNTNEPLRDRTIAEIAKAAGKSAGVVTSVQWSHATPAGLGGAHTATRNDYTGIANEMLNAPWLDVIMGAGHPEFTDDGTPRGQTGDCQYVGGTVTWKRLKSGTHPAGWKLIESKADFEALTRSDSPPAKVLGVAQAATTLQEKRSKGPATIPGGRPRQPFARRLNANVPSLETMTGGALECLGRNPEGFFLMIEGGAVDWANHTGEGDRMVEEQVGFLEALGRVVRWVKEHSSWRETLLIVTADHETGLLWGPDSNRVPFDPIVDQGRKKLPRMRFNSEGHSNSLVPLYARGAGSADFKLVVMGTDRAAAAAWGISGRYVDNTSIFTVMQRAIAERPKK